MVSELATKDYWPRIADALLVSKLASAGAVEIRGPKWCGKTETALQRASSAVMMQDPDEAQNNLLLARTKPSVLLRGARPRLIDEWQDAPQLWDAVRYAVDREREAGSYILTGSATPYAKPRHTGAGRIASLEMLPMSLFESRDSTGEVSLRSLFEGDDPDGHSTADVETLAQLTCRGGWPWSVVGTSTDTCLETAYNLVDTICHRDISKVDDVARNPQHARVIMQEYARVSSTQAKQTSIRRDLAVRGTELSRDTIDSYIARLRELYVIQDLPAWTPSLRARSRITRTPTRHFCDPSLAVAALGASPDPLLRDMATFGLLFETLCVRDLRAYAGAINGRVFHYHDESGLEADAVVELRDGTYALFEVKMGAWEIDDGAANLLKLARKIDVSVTGTPAFCAVITPGGYAYRREDEVLVVPITCLAP